MAPPLQPELGFGTSSLAKNSTVGGAVRNLETAFGAGITHFDTAPAYGFGHAEMLLGKFIAPRRDRVTVSTKYGITPRRIPFALLPVFNLVRKPLKKALALAVRASGSDHHHAFSYATDIDPQVLEDSLHNSLRELRTDYVDNFLLHRIDSSLANREDVVDRLLRLREAGKLRRFGLAGSYEDIFTGEPLREDYTVLQFGDDPREPREVAARGDRLYFRFGLFSLLGEARSFLAGQGQGEVSPVRLCMAYYRQPERKGTTLFSSSRNANILDVVRQWNAYSPLPEALYTDFTAYLRAKQSPA